jgi:long-chain acyl-CoA synthetase
VSETAQDPAVTEHDLTTEASLLSAFQRTVARVPDRVAIRTLGDGVSITWREYGERVESIARGLAGLGVSPGDTVAIMLVNRPEFHLVDTAALHLGAATVSVYNTYPAEDVAYVVGDAGAKVMVCEAAFVDVVQAARAQAGLEQVVVVDDDEPADALSLARVEREGDPELDFEERWRAVGQDDLAVLIYTSGTTGPPKGVELTHGSILGNLQAVHRGLGTMDGARVVSMLPMAHIAERQWSHYRPMVYGGTTTTCPDVRQMVEHLLDTRPHYFFCPPRPAEKFRMGLQARIAKDPELGASAQELFALAARELELQKTGEPLPADQAESLAELRATVGRRLLSTFGLECVEMGMIGAAPVQPDLIGFFFALGAPLLEAWGLSECGAFGAFNRPGDIALGTVGKPPPGVEVKLADDDEILLRSPWIMRGYRNLPEQTAETIDAEGWLHTGDVGAFDDRGNLKIVDRKKELIINASGKNMSPVNIETKLKDASPLIGQAVAIGDSRPYNVALVVLDPDVARQFAKRIGLPKEASREELVAAEELQQEIARAVAAANEQMSRVEQIKRFRVLPEEWMPGGEELTPTMKLKRKPIAEKYQATIDELYA